jgi:hypothetical protein
MTETVTGAAAPLTADQWRDLDRRVSARDIDAWARAARARTQSNASEVGQLATDDATQYVAKLGLTADGCVLAMSRAHDYVVVPPPERLALASLALHDQPFGFDAADVASLRRAAEAVAMADPAGDRVAAGRAADELRRLASRIEALLPP